MSPRLRFGMYWLWFSAVFVALQLVIADERPDWFGVAVLVVAALPVAFLLRSLDRRRNG